jgi:quinol monooxygenase YgiN
MGRGLVSRVIFVARIPVREGRLDDAIAAITSNVEASHQEDGVLRMALHRDVDRPDALVVVEIFRSEADHEQHLTTRHYGRVVEALGPLLAGEVEAMRLEAIAAGDPDKGSLAGPVTDQ